MKEFFPNVEYNKSKRKKFLLFFILTVLVFASLTALFAIKKNLMLVMILGFIVLMLLILLPRVLGNYPTKSAPVIAVDKKEIIVNGASVLKLSDIIEVNCTVIFQPESKFQDEIAEEIKKAAENPTETEYLGNCDITFKAGRKEEVLYTTVNDVVGALQALVNFGVRKYKLAFAYKKAYEVSNYKFFKETPDVVENVSKKERLKQLI